MPRSSLSSPIRPATQDTKGKSGPAGGEAGGTHAPEAAPPIMPVTIAAPSLSPRSSGILPPLPRTGVVLIGTAESVKQGDAMLRLLDRPPIVSGCVLIAASSGVAGDLPVVALGTLHDLPALAARLGLKAGVVCLSEGHPMRSSAAVACANAGMRAHTLPSVEHLLSLPLEGANVQAKHHDEQAGASVRATSSVEPKAAWTPQATVDLAALINRVPHDLDREAVAQVLTGKRVLITGAGGSIGSELARVAASFAPSEIILMERGENALFEVDRLIAQKYPKVARKAVLHDVVDAEATMRALETLKPHTVFHAAAHKHVPLMEDHPAHAVTNNLFGTKSIADAAIYAQAERFVMISSDKAVNPTSVMGATKRMAEMYIHALGYRHASHDADRRTRLSMVRFGNVLGSNASVLTIWSQQISEGGPLTVTDPRMTRYFMTIPEAATLVIQSTTLAPEGHPGAASAVGVFVLDMGEPIPIAELALRFIRSHSLTPRVRTETSTLGATELASRLGGLLAGTLAGPGIDVVFTGARPGEKLHEELAYAAESLRPTAHPGVRAWAGGGFDSSVAGRAERMVVDMAAARMSADRHQVLSMIRKHVPEMRPPQPPTGLSTHPNVG